MAKKLKVEMSALSDSCFINVSVKRNANGFIEIKGNNNKCLKAAFCSFETITKKENGAFAKTSIILHVKENISKKKILHFSQNLIAPECDINHEIQLLQCAVDDVLSILHSHNCVGKKVVTFQARKGDFYKKNLEISGFSFIVLEKVFPVSSVVSEGMIASVDAYVEEKKVYLHLNQISDEQIKKIETILIEYLPKA